LSGEAVLGGKVALAQVYNANVSISGALSLGGVERPSGELLHSILEKKSTVESRQPKVESQLSTLDY
jgi:hypothetical protein